jgi:hypothetical protein
LFPSIQPKLLSAGVLRSLLLQLDATTNVDAVVLRSSSSSSVGDINCVRLKQATLLALARCCQDVGGDHDGNVDIGEILKGALVSLRCDDGGVGDDDAQFGAFVDVLVRCLREHVQLVRLYAAAW